MIKNRGIIQAPTLVPQYRHDTFVIVSIVLLVAISLIVLLVSLTAYKTKIKSVTLNENRFLTTEWHLLQELKVQTDKQLREKDSEIAELQERYRVLKTQNPSSSLLTDVQTALKEAISQRDTLLSTKLVSVPETVIANQVASASQSIRKTETDSTVSGDTATSMDTPSPLTGIFALRIKELEGQLVESHKALEASKLASAEQTSSVPKPAPISVSLPPTDLKTTQTPVDAKMIAAASTEATRKVIGILESKRKDLEKEPAPLIEDIKTRSLLRAIVSTAAVKKEYPTLLESLDRYFEVFKNQARVDGLKDAYNSAIDALKPAAE